uniref:MRG domain-containing protein n=1 Tax=Panagrolaimus sp. PS1159 TaxID=55785 RepID=A0AC35GAR1_9BILA
PSNARQGPSTSSLEGAAETTKDEADTGDDLLFAPYLAQVPKEKRNNLIFPVEFDRVLNVDYDLVNCQLKLPKTPPRYTIDDILSKFVESQSQNPDLEDIKDNIDDLVIFFNKVINLRVLYQLEFVQHLACLNKKRRLFGLFDLAADDFLDQEEFNCGLESPMSEEAKEEEKVEQAGSKNFKIDEDDFNFVDTYGFIHLVRFFYFYNSLLKSDTVANGIYTKYAELINEIIKFLNVNVSKYFKIEENYEIGTPA